MELRNLQSFLGALWAPGTVQVIQRAVTTAAFKLLRFIFGVFQAAFWQLNGTAKQVREAHRPENYELSAHVLDIRMMHKFCDVQLFAMDNFICTHNRFESPQYVFDNDNINLMFFTDTHAVFCEPLLKDMLLWRSEFSPFMRRAQMRYCSRLIVVPLSVFHRMAETVGDPKGDLMFVVNAGRSGSTLVMKLLENTGKYVTIVEPDSISRIIGNYRKFGATSEIRQLLRNIVRIECRPYHSCQPTHGYVIKIIALCASAMPLLGELYPSSRYLFTYRDVTKVGKSLYRLSCAMPSLKLVQLLGRLSPAMAAGVLDWMGYGGIDFNVLIDNDLTFGATCVLAAMKAYGDFRRHGFNAKAVRYEDLVARPLETCEHLMDWCGLPASLAQDVVGGMQADSQQKTAISRAALRQFRDPEVTPKILAELNKLAAKFGLPPVDEDCFLEGTLS